MSNDQSGSNANANGDVDSDVLKEVDDSPVLQGHSALNDPNLSGSTASSWTGTGGPDPGGSAGKPGDAGSSTDAGNA